MQALHQDIDPNGLLEYSVVYTDRALNHMSRNFQRVMNDISRVLKEVYKARSAVVVPGSGTYGMEAVARQFATGKPVLVIRNGWFSYRWTQIFEMGSIPSSSTVLKARQTGPGGTRAPFAPAPIEEVVAAIRAEKPAVVFAPHVETSAGMILPPDYLRAVGAAVREVGGLFVLDCIASGCIWVDMQDCNVDVLISAPQKGWSSTPCAGLVMLGERARADLKQRGMDIDKMPPIPPDTFKEQAQTRVRLGLLVAELVRSKSLQAKPDQLRKQVEEFAQSYENPGELIRYYFSDRTRLAEVEAIVVEQNVVDWVLSAARIVDRALAFDELMAAG